MLSKFLFQKKFLLTLTALLVFALLFLVIIFRQITLNHDQKLKQLEQMMVQKAVSHFEDMLVTREWNARHGGVYVKRQEGLEPNPYLSDNRLQIDDNTTLIKINPAWMTRQISELSNQQANRYYKITSLLPLNPDNAPDDFEKEALLHLEKNPDQTYYYTTIDQTAATASSDTPPTFNFLGRLDMQDACMKCHAFQGYKTGDLRGGIRISLSSDDYREALLLETEQYSFNLYVTAFLTSMLGLLTFLVIYLLVRGQKKLSEFNRTLETEVKERTRELHALNEHLEEKVAAEVLKSKEKDELIIAQSRHAAMGEMIAMIAHQWRQPLSTITMDINNMLVDIELDDIDKARFREYAQSIITQTDHLSMTIDDFRNFFRRENTQEETLLSSVVNECFAIMGDALKSHDIAYNVTCDSEQRLNIYSRELLQVLINIVNNAKDALCDSDTANRRIDVLIVQEGDFHTISICDNGTGIDTEVLPRIFEPYFSTKENMTGTGLGLYMSKMIIEEHMHGKISVQSEPGRTCFSITL